MSSTNRKLRRAIEAQRRQENPAVNPVDQQELRFMQEMYDAEVLKRTQAERRINEAEATIAALIVETGETSVKISGESIRFVQSGGIEGFRVNAEEDGVEVFVVLYEGDDEDDIEEYPADDEAE